MIEEYEHSDEKLHLQNEITNLRQELVFAESEEDEEAVEELNEFIEQLNTSQFQQVQKFFDTMPKLKHEVRLKNPKTKIESEVTLTGLNDFFA